MEARRAGWPGMNPPASRFLAGRPRLHYLEWNPAGRDTVVLLHGNSANAWWWRWMAAQVPADLRLLALDLRGHGDSRWVRPPAYRPEDYAEDVMRLIGRCAQGAERPVVAGHSMGAIAALALAGRHPQAARALAVIDVALTSSERRDRYLARLRALPTVSYPDIETAKARFRLIPEEGAIAPEVRAATAEKSLTLTPAGRFTHKFDRETFLGSDGLDVRAALGAVSVPTLLVRGERSRIMTADAAQEALRSNPRLRLYVIAGAHHHLPLESPGALGRALSEFVESLRRDSRDCRLTDIAIANDCRTTKPQV